MTASSQALSSWCFLWLLQVADMSGIDEEEDEDEESAADVTPNNSEAKLTNGISNHNDTAGSVDWGAPVSKPQTADSFDWGAPVSSSKPQTADSMDWGVPVTSNSKCRILLHVYHLPNTGQDWLIDLIINRTLYQ